MKPDSRITKLAQVLVRYSLGVKEQEAACSPHLAFLVKEPGSVRHFGDTFWDRNRRSDRSTILEAGFNL